VRSSRPDILWLTNIPTPYTVPTWRELDSMCDLRIACLARAESNRSWRVDTRGLKISLLNAPRVHVSHEQTIYGPSLRLIPLLLRRPKVVVLDGWESLAALQSLLVGRLLGSQLVISYWSTPSTHSYHRGPIASYRRKLFSWASVVLTPGIRAAEAAAHIGVADSRIKIGIAPVDAARFARSKNESVINC